MHHQHHHRVVAEKISSSSCYYQAQIIMTICWCTLLLPISSFSWLILMFISKQCSIHNFNSFIAAALHTASRWSEIFFFVQKQVVYEFYAIMDYSRLFIDSKNSNFKWYDINSSLKLYTSHSTQYKQHNPRHDKMWV